MATPRDDLTAAQSRPFSVLRHGDGSRHHELQLAHGGVIKGWILPRGLPTRRGLRRLAIAMADRAPDAVAKAAPRTGEAGDGHEADPWDEGIYRPRYWSNQSIVFTLHGRRLDGTFALIRFPRAGPTAWLLFRTGSTSGARRPPSHSKPRRTRRTKVARASQHSTEFVP